MNERQRAKNLTKRKLRPRDFFDVEGIMERREQKAIQRIKSREAIENVGVVVVVNQQGRLNDKRD